MKAKLDQPVALEGIARNAKGGAVVLVGESPVYLEGLESWPAGLDGSAVRVTGTLREKKSLPDPVNERGELVQGAWGAQLVLEAPKWERR